MSVFLSARPVEESQSQKTATGRKVNAVDRVYDALRNDIVALELKPGAVLSRSDVAVEYGVSQTPVREALARLQGEGAISVYPQSKTVVSRIGIKALFEAHFHRLAVETALVRRLARRPGKVLVGALTDTIAEWTRLWNSQLGDQDLSETGLARIQSLEHDFHKALFDAAGMPGLFDQVLGSLIQQERCRSLVPLRRADQKLTLRLHVEVLERILARDPDGAEGAMHALLAGSFVPVRQLAQQYPDYFET